MIFKKIQLSENSPEAYLEAAVADKIEGFTRKALIVIPGGGYSNICSDREGEPIAQAFMPYGYNTFVLHYSVRKHGKTFPAQLIQASLAIKHVRDNAREYGIDPEQVFVVGFSAGGHLAASLATMWDLPEIYEAVDMPVGYNKPTGAMLVYPVNNHTKCFENLYCSDSITKEQEDRVIISRHISEKTSPLYIVHTSNDQIVDVRDSLDIAYACKNIGLTFELHIYPDAPHGVALGNEITECGNPKYNYPAMSKWIENAARWAETIK